MHQYDFSVLLSHSILFTVYGIDHMAASMVINLGVFLASPLNFITSTIGACLGTLMGVAFLSASAASGTGDMQEVNDKY